MLDLHASCMREAVAQVTCARSCVRVVLSRANIMPDDISGEFRISPAPQGASSWHVSLAAIEVEGLHQQHTARQGCMPCADHALCAGFKSFLDHVIAGPLGHFTAIIGPNGLGKSVMCDFSRSFASTSLTYQETSGNVQCCLACDVWQGRSDHICLGWRKAVAASQNHAVSYQP